MVLTNLHAGSKGDTDIERERHTGRHKNRDTESHTETHTERNTHTLTESHTVKEGET